MNDRPTHDALRYDPFEIEARWGPRLTNTNANTPAHGDLDRHHRNIAESYGIDTVRLALLQQDQPVGGHNRDTGRADQVDDSALEGCARFLGRVWRLARTDTDHLPRLRSGEWQPADDAVDTDTHRFIARTVEATDSGSHHIALAGCMAFTNRLYRYVQDGGGPQREVIANAIDSLLLLMAPMTPHVTAELWFHRHHGANIQHQPRPKANPAKLAQAPVAMAVQVNSRTLARIEVDAGISESDAEAVALACATVQSQLHGRRPNRVIVRAPDLVNVVAREA